MEKIQRIIKSLKEECDRTCTLACQVYNEYNKLIENISDDVNCLSHSNVFELSKFLDEKTYKMHTINMDVEFVLESVSDFMHNSLLRNGGLTMGYHAMPIQNLSSNILSPKMNEVSNKLESLETITPNKTERTSKTSLIDTRRMDNILENTMEKKCVSDNTVKERDSLANEYISINNVIKKSDLEYTKDSLVNNICIVNETIPNKQIGTFKGSDTEDDEDDKYYVEIQRENVPEVALTPPIKEAQSKTIEEILGTEALKKSDSALDAHFDDLLRHPKTVLYDNKGTDSTDYDTDKSEITVRVDPPPPTHYTRKQKYSEKKVNNSFSQFWDYSSYDYVDSSNCEVYSPYSKSSFYSEKCQRVSNTLCIEDFPPLGSSRSSLRSRNGSSKKQIKKIDSLETIKNCKQTLLEANKFKSEIEPPVQEKRHFETGFIKQDNFMSYEEDYFEPCKSNVAVPSKMSDKVKNLKVKTVQERYYDKLPKAPAPNIAFKRSNENPFAKEKKSEGSKCSNENESENKPCSSSSLGVIIPDRKFPPTGTTCSVSYIKSPGDFYLQVDDEDYPLLETLMLELQLKYNDTFNQFRSKKDARKRIGKYCIVNADLCGYKWYRCEVDNWLEIDNEKVHIRLIDYGDFIEYISYKSLRLINSTFIHLPKFAIHCHMACIYPLGSTSDNRKEEWPAETTNVFKEMVIDQILKITFARKMPNSFGVELERLDSVNQSIGEYLIYNDFAVDIPNKEDNENEDNIKEGNNKEFVTNPIIVSQVKQAQGLAGITKEMSQVEIVEQFLNDRYSKEAGDINEAVTNYNPLDETRTCEFVRQGLMCHREDCHYDHTPLKKDGYTTDQIPVYINAFNELVLPRKGEQVELKVTSVRSFKTFFAQITDYDGEEFKILTINMNQVENVWSYKDLQMQPIIGQIVMALCYDNWYRAKVIDTIDLMDSKELNVEVILVDFGVKEEIPLSHISTIPKIFLHLPFQAVFCVLSNVVIKDDVSPNMAMEHFESRYLSQYLLATIKEVTSSSSLEVDMKNKGKDVGEELIEMGFVLPANNISPADSEMVLVD